MSETYANPSVHFFTNSQGAGEREVVRVQKGRG